MTNNDIQNMIGQVYDVAEQLYLASGFEIPDGYSFSRSLGEDAELMYQAAAIAMMNRLMGEGADKVNP